MAEPIVSTFVLDHYLALAIGPPGAASLERAVRLAGEGVLDGIVPVIREFADVEIVTDVINQSCVYLVRLDNGDCAAVRISTLLPVASVAIYRSNVFERFTVLDEPDEQLAKLGDLLRRLGIAVLDEATCRADSLYRNDEGTGYDTYFEVLFEFDAAPPWKAFDPRQHG